MGSEQNFLAYDLGAESGRAVLGQLKGGKLSIETLHRFANTPTEVCGTLHWNVLELFREMVAGLRAFGKTGEKPPVGLSVDTWGVDFGILDRQGTLVGNPVHYRDRRNDGMMDKAFEIVSREEIFKRTGLQFLPFNTIFQLLSMRLSKSPLLARGNKLLLMSDLFNYFFSGRQAFEFSQASTTQLMDPRKKVWAKDLMRKLGIPSEMFPKITPSATIIGMLLPSLAKEAGFSGSSYTGTPVIAGLGHDTGAAVAAVPGKGDDWCYISSGTWSLMGAELRRPCINKKALKYNFTNEGGLDGSIRFLKNIAGLWLVQQSRAQWAREGQTLSYATITAQAARCKPLRSLVDPDHPEFLAPGDMATRIAQVCRGSGEPVPASRGAIVRCALESLAMRYRWVLERMEECLNKKFKVIHIVGGGTQNELLSQMTADATGRKVVTGPVEATAIGNLLSQAVALGTIGSHDEMRAVIRRSFPTKTYKPKNRRPWEKRYQDWLRLI